MRVSDAARYKTVNAALQRIAADHAKASREASTGQRVNRPSDDPQAAAELVRLRHAGSKIDAHIETLRYATSDLEQSEAALAAASDLFVRARELAMQGGNGALDASGRSLLAEQVRALEQELVGIANQQGARGHLFAGSKTDAVPFASNGAFSGDGVDHVVDVGAGATSASASGALAFTASGGRDVFTDLAQLRTALAADDSAGISASLDGLEASRKQIEQERGKSGLSLEKLRAADQVLEQGRVDVARASERVGAADAFEAFSKLTSRSGAFERAIAVSKQMLDLGSRWR